MGRYVIVGKGFPGREEIGLGILYALKKTEIFKKEFGILKPWDNDQKRPSHPFSPMR
jgi:hypothetical protein